MSSKQKHQAELIQLRRQLTDSQRALDSVTAERDRLRFSLSHMAENFESLIATQTYELKQARDEALSASKTKTEFLANMSHEIRTPLTAIIGFANSLSDESLSAQDLNLATAAISRNSHHLMAIISDILDLAKIEHHQFELEQVEFDLFALLEDIEETISAQAIEKNLWFNVNFQFPIPQIIKTDPTWVKQILLNLAGNALKFTHVGGIDIHVGYQPKYQKITMSVIDSGIGITAQQQDKIFERFSQADTTTTRRYGGTGLGLTICTKLVELMNGSLTVESEHGHGSQFSFDFSIAPVKADALLQDPCEVKTRANEQPNGINIPSLKGHVLVAEDSPDTQNLLALYIKKTGAELTFADNGEQAVELALTNSYDLVLMDIQMPIVDGIEATGILRRLGFSKPIVAFTANALKQELEQAIAAGCNGYLTKPIDKHNFYQLLNQHLITSDTPAPGNSNDSLIDDAQLRDIQRNFITRTPQLLSELRHTFEQQDWPHGKILIHTFKGTCGSLGFKHLYTISNQLEQLTAQVDSHQITAINDVLEQLQQEINQQMMALNVFQTNPKEVSP